MNQRGFTLVEMLVYVAVFTIVVSAVAGFLFWTIRSNVKARVLRETLENSHRALEIVTDEIRRAQSVYTPTSTSTQISLETTAYLPPGEIVSYVDIYQCGTSLCLKREDEAPFALTSEAVEVMNVAFQQVGTTSQSVAIELTLRYKNPQNLAELNAVVAATTTAALRNY